MECHVLSCAGSAWRGRTGPAAVVPVRRSGYSARFLRLAVSGIGLSSRSVFASFSRCPAARRGGPTMPRAIARAGGRVGAGAVRAPDCARARAQAQGAPLLPAPSVVFRAGPGAGGSGLRKPLPVFCSVFILAYFAELQALRRYFFIISCHEIEYSGKNTGSRDRRRPPPRIGSGAAGRVWAASAKSGKPDFSSRSFARAGERGAKVRPARPAGTPDKRRREMCACGSPLAGEAGWGTASASGSGGANAAIRNVRRIRRGGRRSLSKTRHAERPTPGPSRRAGGEHDGTFPNMSPASRTLV